MSQPNERVLLRIKLPHVVYGLLLFLARQLRKARAGRSPADLVR